VDKPGRDENHWVHVRWARTSETSAEVAARPKMPTNQSGSSSSAWLKSATYPVAAFGTRWPLPVGAKGSQAPYHTQHGQSRPNKSREPVSIRLAEAIANSERQSTFESHAKKSFSIHADKAASAKAIRLVRSKSVRAQSRGHIPHRMQIATSQAAGNP
jgi:hypothetical protein